MMFILSAIIRTPGLPIQVTRGLAFSIILLQPLENLVVFFKKLLVECFDCFLVSGFLYFILRIYDFLHEKPPYIVSYNIVYYIARDNANTQKDLE